MRRLPAHVTGYARPCGGAVASAGTGPVYCPPCVPAPHGRPVAGCLDGARRGSSGRASERVSDLIGWVPSPQVTSLVVNMLEQGALFGFLGLGVLITFRFFRFPDLTAEGSYPLGGAVVAALLVSRVNPFLATGAAVLAGAAAGVTTALVHTKLRINNIIAGIIVMTAIYTVNLRVMGRANTSLLDTSSVF